MQSSENKNEVKLKRIALQNTFKMMTSQGEISHLYCYSFNLTIQTEEINQSP